MNEDLKSDLVISYVRENYAGGVKIPWFFKMVIKILLSKLPVSYEFWTKIGVFKHGDLDKDLKNIHDSFQEHINYYKDNYEGVPDYCLELGPGDSLGHALSANSLGIKGVWFIDVGDYATKDPDHYKDFYNYLCSVEKKHQLTEALTDFNRDDVLKHTGSNYGTEGLNSFSSITDSYIGFSYSHAVLEHVGRDEFSEYMHQLYRIHKTGTVSRHWVDLHDHLGGALNSFRFSPKFWESKLIQQAGFYTNRLTMKEMIGYAHDAGFRVEIKRINKWKKIPTPLKNMNKYFTGKSEEELNICTFLMVLEKV